MMRSVSEMQHDEEHVCCCFGTRMLAFVSGFVCVVCLWRSYGGVLCLSMMLENDATVHAEQVNSGQCLGGRGMRNAQKMQQDEDADQTTDNVLCLNASQARR